MSHWESQHRERQPRATAPADAVPPVSPGAASPSPPATAPAPASNLTVVSNLNPITA